MNSETTREIVEAVDAAFDAQFATTRDIVAIPSTRGAEGPCQDMIGDLLRERGYEVDDWQSLRAIYGDGSGISCSQR